MLLPTGLCAKNLLDSHFGGKMQRLQHYCCIGLDCKVSSALRTCWNSQSDGVELRTFSDVWPRNVAWDLSKR